jgi:hypothetical protein
LQYKPEKAGEKELPHLKQINILFTGKQPQPDFLVFLPEPDNLLLRRKTYKNLA